MAWPLPLMPFPAPRGAEMHRREARLNMTWRDPTDLSLENYLLSKSVRYCQPSASCHAAFAIGQARMHTPTDCFFAMPRSTCCKSTVCSPPPCEVHLQFDVAGPKRSVGHFWTCFVSGHSCCPKHNRYDIITRIQLAGTFGSRHAIAALLTFPSQQVFPRFRERQYLLHRQDYCHGRSRCSASRSTAGLPAA